jgi:hypothetical protein
MADINSIFSYPLDRLTDMKIGDVINYPAADYWKVNARRTRAEKKIGGKYKLRVKDSLLYVLREK